MHSPNLPTLLLTLLTLTPHTTPLTLPSPPYFPNSEPPAPSCTPTNALQNPSFESDLPPWMDIVTSSFVTRGVFTSPDNRAHSGAHFYYAMSNSSVDASLTLSQGFGGVALAPDTQSIQCTAYLASSRPDNLGFLSVELFLDGVRCGEARRLGTTGWTRVGGLVGLQEIGGLEGWRAGGHSLAVVIIGYGAGGEGWEVWVDDVVVGRAC
ncbi:hypothetical protein IAQ61_010372 [Plenodomus lingam]|nr:hypothetical protein IAQ61_010372 [Plenodomus lingam]